jgi:hypothetical protein
MAEIVETCQSWGRTAFARRVYEGRGRPEAKNNTIKDEVIQKTGMPFGNPVSADS